MVSAQYPAGKKSKDMLLPSRKLMEIGNAEEITVRAAFGSGFAAFRKVGFTDILNADLFWINDCGDGQVFGRKESLQLSCKEWMNFLQADVLQDQPKEHRMLAIKEGTPRFVFRDTKNLQECIADTIIRRKLVRYLRDHFHWRGFDTVEFYDAFTPYSFIYQALSRTLGATGGALILDGAKNPETTHYIHLTRNYEEM